MFLVGAFGLSLVAVGVLDNLGVKVNETAVQITLECLKYGGVLYIIKLASNLFL